MNNLIKKIYYGDIPEEKTGGGAPEKLSVSKETAWPLWEVFIRSKQGLDHKHVGSLKAADATMAIENARGWWKANKYMPQTPMMQRAYTYQLKIKFIGTQHFMYCQMK
jgi:hypothetical protein